MQRIHSLTQGTSIMEIFPLIQRNKTLFPNFKLNVHFFKSKYETCYYVLFYFLIRENISMILISIFLGSIRMSFLRVIVRMSGSSRICVM